MSNKRKYEIPEGYEARIDGNKVIIEKKESDDERMVKFIKKQLFNIKKTITENYELDAKLTNAIDWLEKQGEQKPTGLSEKIIADVFEKVGLAKIVRDRENDAFTEALQSAMIELAKYSVVPQPEEDKDIMYNTISNLTELKDRYGEEYGKVGKCIDWIKSLRPQTTWRPTHEQINALYERVLKGGCCNGELMSLYTDLLKLKE